MKPTAHELLRILETVEFLRGLEANDLLCIQCYSTSYLGKIEI